MLVVESILQNTVGPTLIREVRASQRAKGLVASGKSSESLYFTVARKGAVVTFELIGLHYWEYQQRGRGPNAKQGKPSPSFVQIIRRWIEVKGLGIPLKAAYPIAFKLMREGTKVPNPHNAGGVLSEPLNQDKVREMFIPSLTAHYVDSIRSKIFA